MTGRACGALLAGRRADRSAGACAGERGAATVYALALVMVLVSGGVGALAVGSAIVARHRADSAADLVALSAAAAAGRGSADACAVAARVAQAQHATLATCRLAGNVVEVTVNVAPPSFGGLLPPAVGRARAGPATVAGDYRG